MIGVGISGKLASGKSTIANVLIEEYGFQRVSMAEPLKVAAKQIVDFFTDGLAADRSMDAGEAIEFLRMYGDKSAQQGRRFLQFFGTDVMRAIYPDVWVQAFLHSVRNGNYKRVVVDDVRFRNEANSLEDGGFSLARVEMPEDLRLERISRLYPGYDSANLAHPSETDLDSWGPWDIEFDGSIPIDEFRESARDWAARLLYVDEPF